MVICQEIQCKKKALFNIIGEKPIYCGTHKKKKYV